MFTDIHAHILPGVDDGCESLDQSLELIDSALKNNVSNIILTPHFTSGDNSETQLTRDALLKRIGILRQYLKNNLSRAGEIKLFPGMEIRISPGLIGLLKKKDLLLTLLDGNKNILVDVPFLEIQPYLFDILFKLKLSGLTPIFAHPERYEFIMENMDIIRKIKDIGSLIQIDNSSLVSKNDKRTYIAALRLLKSGLVDLIASDSHFARGRSSNFINAYEVLIKTLGKKEAAKIAIENPDKILSNSCLT